MKAQSLSFMTEHEQAEALNGLPADELTDLFDLFSDHELKENLNFLHKKARQRVLSLMKFHPESAGGIMETEVFTLMEDFTIEKSIKLMQRPSTQQRYSSTNLRDRPRPPPGWLY